jgi:type II secretory pathway pseudopilin PulG
MQSRSRRAFTMYDLVVVVALSGFFGALLPPIIVQARTAAARTQSVNNLKQIALAAHSYLDQGNAFPEGNDNKNFSAAARLLPYLEEDELYKQIDFTKALDDKANAAAPKAVVRVFCSPLDPQERAPANYGPTNYFFNAGSKPSLDANDGVFYQNSIIRPQDITDGFSNTLMIVEMLKGDGGIKAVDVRRQHVLLKKDALKNLKDDSGVAEFKGNKNIVGDRGASWMDGRFLQTTFTATRVANDKRPDVSCEGVGGLSAVRSWDKAGFYVAMCDGSVRFVQANLSLNVWKALATRNGKEDIPDF